MADIRVPLIFEMKNGQVLITAATNAEALGKKTAAAQKSADTLSGSFSTSTSRAGQFAGALSATSTTLARSAGTLNLPVQALRALDDVADVAALGLDNLSKSAAGFNAATLGVVGAGLAIGTTIGGWLRDIPAVEKAADSSARAFTDWFGGLSEGAKAAITAVSPLVGLLGRLTQTPEPNAGPANFAEIQKKAAAGQEALLRSQTKGMTSEEAEVFLGLKKQLPVREQIVKDLEKQEAATKKATEAQKRLNEELQRMRDAYMAPQAEADKLAEAMEGVNLLQDLSSNGAQKLAEKIRQLQADGAKLPPTFLAFAESLEEANRQVQLVGPTLDQLMGKAGTGGIAQLPRLLGPGGGQIGKDLLSGVPASKTLFIEAGTEGGTFIAKGIGEGIKKSIGGALQGLPNVIMQAITGGGNIGQAIGAHLGQSIAKDLGKSLGDKLGADAGKFLGKAVGSVVPVLGTLLGGALGSKIGGFFGKLFGGGEEKKVNELRDQFFKTVGGFEALQKRLVGLTNQDLVKKIFDAKTVEQFNAAVKESQDLLDLQDQAQKELDATVEKYGITLDQTSQVFAQSKVNEQALDFWKEFRLLTEGAGVSVENAIKAMGEKGFTDFVNQARSAGAALPEQLRPMVEELIRSGQLLDENGNAFKSAEEAGITFAETVTESVSRMADAIERLVAALTGMPAPRPVHVPVTYDEPPDGKPGAVHAQHGFHGMVTQPTWFLTGEAGPEHVSVTPSGQSTTAGPMSVNYTVNVSVEGGGAAGADPAAIADAVVSEMRRRNSLLLDEIRRTSREAMR